MAALLLYSGFTVGALYVADYTTGRRGLKALQELQALAHLPARSPGQSGTIPAWVKGTLYVDTPRRSPRGLVNALWYAWVDDLRGSGRSSYTVTVCTRQENTGLTLRLADGTPTPAVPLDLFDGQVPVALLKGSWLEALPRDQVALDLGELYHSRQIPPAMAELCRGKIPAKGKFTYYEASIPIGSDVTVLGCATDGTIHHCGTPPGVLAVNGVRPVLRAYANDCLVGIRGAAALVLVALSLLASTLFGLRAAAGKS